MYSLGFLDLAAVIFTCVVAIYTYASRKRNYWKNLNVPHEKFSLIFGGASKFLFKPFHEVDQERYLKMGKLFGIFERGEPVLFVAELDIVKLVLVKDFATFPNRRPPKFFDSVMDNMMGMVPAERWRKIRPAASPAFSTGKLRKMTEIIAQCIKTTSRNLRGVAEQGEIVDVKRFFSNYALDAIARCAFSINLDSYSDESNEFAVRARKVLSNTMTLPMTLAIIAPRLVKLFKLKPLGDGAFGYFQTVCRDMMRKRAEGERRQEDFLQLMMDAQKGVLSAAGETTEEAEHKLFDLGSDKKTDSNLSAKKLTEDEAIAQLIMFIVVGHDTVSTSIALTIYSLAMHPEIQVKLREEVDECFEKHGEEPDMDTVSKLQYLHCVVSEVLRMYPTGTRLMRTTIEKYVLGNTGITLPKGSAVAIPVYAMHHDPDNFPNPSVFDPERFSPENVSSIRPYSYLPFGGGPRNCVGMRFGLHLMKLILLHTIRNVEIFRTEKTMVPLECVKSSFFLLDAKTITVGIKNRKI